MRAATKIVFSIILGAGTIGLVYVLLSPSVWPRETFDLFGLAAAIALGSDLAYEVSAARSKARDDMSPGWWVVYKISESLLFAAGCVIVSVLLSEAGPRASLSTGPQQSVFAGACVLTAAILIGAAAHAKGLRRLGDREREARFAAARTLARRNVAEFVEGLGSQKPPDEDNPHPR